LKRTFQSKRFGFHYIRPFPETPDPPIIAQDGYVHGIYEELCRGPNRNASAGRNRYAAPSLAHHRLFFYVLENMIDEAKQRISAGYDRKSIHQNYTVSRLASADISPQALPLSGRRLYFEAFSLGFSSCC